jgi:hypothetical protein
MSQWSERILSHFTADLTRLWVACDPDDVLLDEKLLTELRSRGFELMLYEDPFAFRAEYEERYRAAWDRGERGQRPRWFCICAAPMRMSCRGTSCITVVWFGSALRSSSPGWHTARYSKSSRSILPGCFMPTRPNCSLRAARTSRRTSSSNTSTNWRRDPFATRWTSGASCCGCTSPTARCHPCSPSTRQASFRARAVHGPSRRHMAGIQERAAARGAGCVVPLSEDPGAGWHPHW